MFVSMSMCLLFPFAFKKYYIHMFPLCYVVHTRSICNLAILQLVMGRMPCRHQRVVMLLLMAMTWPGTSSSSLLQLPKALWINRILPFT